MALREWRIRRLNEPRGHIELECPECGLKVIVHRVSWLRASDGDTRPCTGCFRTFYITGRTPSHE